MVWKPRLTVAAVIEQEQGFLMVEEIIDGKSTLNQPAGHVEHGESIIDAVIRETREETAWEFRPEQIIGLYRWLHPNGETYLRVAFSGQAIRHHPNDRLDPDIESVLWLNREQLQTSATQARFRSPLVWRCVEDYLEGRRYPLELLQDVVDTSF